VGKVSSHDGGEEGHRVQWNPRSLRSIGHSLHNL
jgi:hypothetical protein